MIGEGDYSVPTVHFIVHNSYFKPPTSYFLLRTWYFVLRASYFLLLLTSYFDTHHDPLHTVAVT